MLTTIKNKIINIEPEGVLADARDQDLDVTAIEDFRQMAPHYDRIESMMDYYRSSYTNTSILGGLTTGIGGFMTSVTFASIDTASMGLQLYRLSQRFAILNGFDGSDPLQHDKIMNIYFTALGLNAVAQATLKSQLLKAHEVAGSGRTSNSIVLRLIVNMGKLVGKNLSSKSAGRLVPIVGGIAGASLNYAFARKTSDAMKKAYKRAYFEEWQ
ncbi:MAG: EcsC family protein [Balneolaceae bacterium]|nr:EcsC family protein [Balneolaceae bacterium]